MGKMYPPVTQIVTLTSMAISLLSLLIMFKVGIWLETTFPSLPCKLPTSEQKLVLPLHREELVLSTPPLFPMDEIQV